MKKVSGSSRVGDCELLLEEEKQPEILQCIQLDADLPDHIQPSGIGKMPSELRNILLTGVTGHLGPYMLQQLTQNKEIFVFCLVKAASVKVAEERVTKKLISTNLIPTTNMSNVAFVLGNVTEDKLGIQKDVYDILTRIVDGVIHLAVNSNYIKQYPVPKFERTKYDIRSVNIVGTRNILEFACQGRKKQLMHGSTFSAVNRFNLDGTLSEDLPDVDNLGDGLSMGYACSKLVGEKLVRTAMERGLPCMVLRYPIITGDSKTGYTYELDNITLCCISFLSSGLFPDEKWALPYIPVDICAQVTCKLFFNDNAEKGAYNITTPTVAGIEVFYNLAKEVGVVDIKKVTYEEYMTNILEQDKNKFLLIFKKICTEGHGFREFMFSCPALQLGWFDPEKLAIVSKKLEKYVPEYREIVPTGKHVAEVAMKFLTSSGALSDLGIKIKL